MNRDLLLLLYSVNSAYFNAANINLGTKGLAPPVTTQPLPLSHATLHHEPLGTMETVRNIQNPIPPGMLQPSKWLSFYEDFVTKNASSVGQVESALRSLTYIIPGETSATFHPRRAYSR